MTFSASLAVSLTLGHGGSAGRPKPARQPAITAPESAEQAQREQQRAQLTQCVYRHWQPQELRNRAPQLLAPDLGQVFFIGDGVTSGGIFQQFVAPAGATRLALGIPDGFSFVGPPGAYDDNDGAYRIRIGINELPTYDVPEPTTWLLFGGGLAALFLRRRKAQVN